MEGGTDHFGRRCQKQPKLKKKKWSKNLVPMDIETYRGPRGSAPKGLEARRRKTSRGDAVDEALLV